MTTNPDGLLTDLSERIDGAIDELTELREHTCNAHESRRLFGKIQGLKLVKDWLRAYPTRENTAEPKEEA